jgi:hypothetical protein
MAHILRAHTSWSRVVQTKCLTFQAKWIKIDHLDKNRSQENNCAEDTTVIVIVIIAKYKDLTASKGEESIPIHHRKSNELLL